MTITFKLVQRRTKHVFPVNLAQIRYLQRDIIQITLTDSLAQRSPTYDSVHVIYVRLCRYLIEELRRYCVTVVTV